MFYQNNYYNGYCSLSDLHTTFEARDPKVKMQDITAKLPTMPLPAGMECQKPARTQELHRNPNLALVSPHQLALVTPLQELCRRPTEIRAQPGQRQLS